MSESTALSCLFPLRIYTALKLRLRSVLFLACVCFPYEFTLLSNTDNISEEQIAVCFPYEFTLLSNVCVGVCVCFVVCFPYEFTLLSNYISNAPLPGVVCFPYEFTLLSNVIGGSFAFDKFVFPTNLHCSQTFLLR